MTPHLRNYVVKWELSFAMVGMKRFMFTWETNRLIARKSENLHIPQKEKITRLAFAAFCKDGVQVFGPVCQTEALAPNFEFEDGIKL